MPNWTSNQMNVYGDNKTLQEFKEKARVQSDDDPDRKIDFCFEPFLPMPKELNGIVTGGTTINGKSISQWREVNNLTVPLEEKELEELKEKYGATNWYDRNCNVLGTKWDVSGTLITEEEDQLGYTFDSAWAPPLQGIQALSQMYPDLEFELEYEQEEGGGGRVTMKNGDITNEQSWNSSEDEG